jgi:hypothetical protein
MDAHPSWFILGSSRGRRPWRFHLPTPRTTRRCHLGAKAQSDLPAMLSLDQPPHHAYRAPHAWLSAAQPTSPAMPGASLIVVLFMPMAVTMARGLWQWRRTTALGLVLVLGTFTLGIAIHSVHHLLEPEKAGDCLMLSASQHVSGTLAEPCDTHASALTVTTPSPGPRDVPSFIPSFRSDLPRAPPSFPF